LSGRQAKGTLGTGCLRLLCEDALTLSREFKSRGVQTKKRPYVGNRLWDVPVTVPTALASSHRK